MNFVQLLERYRVECGVSGSPITDVGTVRNEHARLKGWLQQAWLDIQSDANGMWEFLRVESSHTIPQYASLLMPSEWSAGSVNRWRIDTFRVGDLGGSRATSRPIDFVSYDAFRVGPGLDPNQRGRPMYFTIRPADKALIVAPAADVAYTLYYEFHGEPVALEDNTDVPVIAPKFHMLPVYRAMLEYGAFEAAPEVLARAQARHDEMMSKLKHEQLPSFQWGPPLA